LWPDGVPRRRLETSRLPRKNITEIQQIKTMTMTTTTTQPITRAEQLGAAFLELIEFFRYGDHLQEGSLTALGFSIGSVEAINIGWLRRAKGPGRYDVDWLVPTGKLATAVAEIRGSRVAATWANYQERRAA
jgi:hypothetical protein